jgi:hypothetical protein
MAFAEVRKSKLTPKSWAEYVKVPSDKNDSFRDVMDHRMRKWSKSENDDIFQVPKHLGKLRKKV